MYDISSGESAAALYKRLETRRAPFLARAREGAAVSIPMLIPRNDNVRGVQNDFQTPKQGVAARGVNHLASRLLMTLLPPSSNFFRLDIDRFARAALKDVPGADVEVEENLRKTEDSVQREVEIQGMRVGGAEIMKHLVVAGNVLQHFMKKGGMSYFPLTQFVVERDAEGDEPVIIVIREFASLAALPTDVQQLVVVRRANKQALSPTTAPAAPAPCETENDVELYTKIIRLEENKYVVQQELVDGTMIPETRGYYKPDDLPYRPLRWTKVKGEAYGRGLLEEYMGDILALEGLSQALVEGALAAARVIGLVRPNGTTRAQDLNKARNGEFVRGHKDDVTFVQLEKFADFRTAGEAGARIEKRLEAAFLLNSSVIRDAERVTAEEVRYVAQELESTLGGVYSILAQEFQLPLVRNILSRLQKSGQVPKMPKAVQPVIVAGADALGRQAELDRLRVALGIVKDTLGPEIIPVTSNADALIKYIFLQAGVKIEGLWKTKEQMAQEQAQAKQEALTQEIISKGTGPAVNALADRMQPGAIPQAAPPDAQQ